MIKIRSYHFLFLCCILFSCAASRPTHSQEADLSPYDFGLSHARNGEARYRVLYNTHVAAVAAGVNVSYKGIRLIDLEIPPDAKSIPLTMKNDFSGVVFNVKNKSEKNIFLFSMERKSVPLEVAKSDIDKGSFGRYPALSKGRNLLVVSDDRPWVEKREGYSYGHTRKDIFLVEDGLAVNNPVMPYNNADSAPTCLYYPVIADSIIVEHLTLNRSSASTAKTYLCTINGVDNLVLKDVTIHTPNNDWTNDVAIVINDCTNVVFKGVTIDGTYSREDYSGYGVNMNNIWNFRVSNMVGHAKWGIFGTNNINVASFEDSDINRFDIHCYGRDISFRNVTFRDKYNQFASVYGIISFNHCNFIDFIPIVNGPSYNSYVGYDVIMTDCVFNRQKGVAMLIDEGYIDDRINTRRELKNRCLPNVEIKNLSLNLGSKIQEVSLFYFRIRGIKKQPIEYLSCISIDGLRIKYEDSSRAPANFEISNIPVRVVTPVQQTYKNIDLIGNSIKVSKGKGGILNRLEMSSAKSTFRTSNIRATSIDNK